MDDIKECLKEIVEKIKREEKVLAILGYGSYFTGKYKNGSSDIDLLIIHGSEIDLFRKKVVYREVEFELRYMAEKSLVKLLSHKHGPTIKHMLDSEIIFDNKNIARELKLKTYSIVESPIVETFSIENRRKSALLIESLYRKVHQVKYDLGFFEFACSKFLLNIADSYIRLHRHWGLQGFRKMISQLKDIDESFAEHFSLAMSPNHIETRIKEIDFLYREVIMLLGGETNSDENFVSQGIMNILNVVDN
ncbi:nucleotidyltransferase domain-containing protein [Photorhabdus bodei]|uniref:Nucleotidyltransferase domain-containing protein n=1 Tax=Photorhabdus bodei TaxID=2029681 RepID=A0ABX0AUG8_9GAMM|nr:nucleotidyltransferase domain-containing protein [Photorhabdus bodei]NDL01202.1 nucleotidyltransferase domain-containing protein [Photorhabdus bodei]NDL05473.1 nucleotidyltransferase domain-containing protein [Photorhabdus bodei]NDL09729.1 nucleotidyltransferase domain-containing protein [Photorhabdus bodei]